MAALPFDESQRLPFRQSPSSARNRVSDIRKGHCSIARESPLANMSAVVLGVFFQPIPSSVLVALDRDLPGRVVRSGSLDDGLQVVIHDGGGQGGGTGLARQLLSKIENEMRK